MQGLRADPITGSATPLPAGLQLQAVGRIPQGTVLRPLGREIMVIGEDRLEAYVVVQGATWTGYYLPSERAYIPLKQPTTLALEPR